MGSIRPAKVVLGVLAAAAVSALPATLAHACSPKNEQVRSQTGSAALPDCRAYELVTPTFKEGIAVSNVPLISTDGSHVIDGALGIFSGAEQNTNGGIGGETGFAGAWYEFVRGEAGWESKPVAPPAVSAFPSSGLTSGGASPDLTRTLWKLRAPSQPEGEGDLYRKEPGGSFVRIGPLQPSGDLPLFGNEGIYVGASRDLAHVLVNKGPSQGRWPGDTTSGEDPQSLYEYAGLEESEPKLVGITNAGRISTNGEAHLVSQCGTEFGWEADKYNAISADGATVFFTAVRCETGPQVRELYARVDEAHTVAISEPPLSLPGRECTGPCREAEEDVEERQRRGMFQGASEDGSKAFFLTEQPLLNSDEHGTGTGMDLYEADLEGGALKKLAMVSEGETNRDPSENDPTPGEGAEVQGVARISEDGSHVFFVARGVLTRVSNRRGEKAEAGTDNLYVFDTASRHTAFIARLSEDDGEVWKQQDNGRPVAAAPDGNVLVFVSDADPTGESQVQGQQVYEYDALTGALVRVSVGQHSTTPAFAPAIVISGYEQTDYPSEASSALTMSDDGSYVFFESPDSLVPGAPNDQEVGCFSEEAGECHAPLYVRNIYEYHEGHVFLIAAVRPVAEGRVLFGTDSSGRDVFFASAAPLLSQDTDTQQDIYDARVEGGFPTTPSLSACSGDSCHGPLSGGPPIVVAASSTEAGGENVAPTPAAVGGHAKALSRRQMLAKALKACKRKPRRKRGACEGEAQKRYGHRPIRRGGR